VDNERERQREMEMIGGDNNARTARGKEQKSRTSIKTILTDIRRKKRKAPTVNTYVTCAKCN